MSDRRSSASGYAAHAPHLADTNGLSPEGVRVVFAREGQKQITEIELALLVNTKTNDLVALVVPDHGGPDFDLALNYVQWVLRESTSAASGCASTTDRPTTASSWRWRTSPARGGPSHDRHRQATTGSTRNSTTFDASGPKRSGRPAGCAWRSPRTAPRRRRGWLRASTARTSSRPQSASSKPRSRRGSQVRNGNGYREGMFADPRWFGRWSGSATAASRSAQSISGPLGDGEQLVQAINSGNWGQPKLAAGRSTCCPTRRPPGAFYGTFRALRRPTTLLDRVPASTMTGAALATCRRPDVDRGRRDGRGSDQGRG